MTTTLRTIKSLSINEFAEYARGAKPSDDTLADAARSGHRITAVFFSINGDNVDIIERAKGDTYQCETFPTDDELKAVIEQFSGREVFIEYTHAEIDE